MPKYLVTGRILRDDKELSLGKPADFEDDPETDALVRDGFLAKPVAATEQSSDEGGGKGRRK